MSFVLSITGNNFSLNMSDGRFGRYSANSIVPNATYEEFKKMIRINNKVCVSFTGDPILNNIILNSTKGYDCNILTLDKFRKLILKEVDNYSFNRFGSRFIISGINRKNKFVSYGYNLSTGESQIYEDIPVGEFVVLYMGNDTNYPLSYIVKKRIYDTMPWNDLGQLRQHMRDCIIEVSEIDKSVNSNIFEELITY